MGYTLGEAAKATGKHITTLSKATKKGKISAAKNGDGSYDIDPAELHRVYPPISKSQDNQPLNGQGKNNDNLLHVKELELRLEAEQKHNKILQAQVDDIKEERDRWRQQATALLSDQRQQRPGSFWQWFMGMKKT